MPHSDVNDPPCQHETTSSSWQARLRRGLPGIAVLVALSVSAQVAAEVGLRPVGAFVFLAGTFCLVLLASRFIRTQPSHGVFLGSAAGLAVSAAVIGVAQIATRETADSLIASNIWMLAAVACGVIGLVAGLVGFLPWNRKPTVRQTQAIGACSGLLTGCLAILGVAARLLEH